MLNSQKTNPNYSLLSKKKGDQINSLIGLTTNQNKVKITTINCDQINPSPINNRSIDTILTNKNNEKIQTYIRDMFEKDNKIALLNIKYDLLSEVKAVLSTSAALIKQNIKHFKNFLSRHFTIKVGLNKTGFKWILYSFVVFIVFSIGLIVMPYNIRPKIHDHYSIYSAKPLILGDSDANFSTKDSRSHRINEIFKEYNCPLEGLGEVFVDEADKNNIPWWVVAAISFQESSCGKQTPEVNGIESHNAWGWGVWGDNVYVFDNWVRGIEKVSGYLGEKFYSKGTSDLCVIMKTYTPPSDGSWCRGVDFFGNEILDFKTPER